VAAFGLRDVVDAADVGMRHAQREAHLGQEALEPIGIALDVTRQELQRDRLTQLEIVGAIDLAHAAAAEEADHAVAARENGSGEISSAVARGAERPLDNRFALGLRGAEHGASIRLSRIL
jgi:hypothetical protein